VAILVVAADDGVMPQTLEAYSHAKAAQIPIIVAVNKIDKADADPERVMTQLSEHGLVPEAWGGDTVMVEVSALQKLGIDDLLEMILLVTELQELQADPTVLAEGIIIEAQMDKRRGPVATALIQNGTLHVGQNILIGATGGRIRALLDDQGVRIQSAGPSMPVEILGLEGVPTPGDHFQIIPNDKQFKQMLSSNKVKDREQKLATQTRNLGVSAVGEVNEQEEQRQKEFNVVLKCDSQGSLEAVRGSITQLSTDEVQCPSHCRAKRHRHPQVRCDLPPERAHREDDARQALAGDSGSGSWRSRGPSAVYRG
jgi:translation initiation factor IF-2